MAQIVSGGGNGIAGSTSAVTSFDPVSEAGNSGVANGLLGDSKWGTGIGNGVTLTTSFFSSSSVYS